MLRTVLIVEDCEESATTLALALQPIASVEVQLFSDAREALTTLMGSPDNVAALVTDLNMPAMDGFELITLIRNDRRCHALPICCQR
jgi:CheY-like chemotaxis protein